MPAQRRGDRLATGETIQEHELDHQKDRRDQQAGDQGQQRETWADWMPDIKETVSEEVLLDGLNRGEVSVNPQDLRTWEEQGLIPAPIPNGREPRYPYPASQVIRRVYLSHQEGRPRSWIQEYVRRLADQLNRTITPTPQNWLDWMPEGVPMPALLSHDELLEALRDRGIDLTSSSFQHYRQRGVLPRPIRRRYLGATRPVYPYWFIPLIEHLKHQQNQGKSLEEIQPTMRDWARSIVLSDVLQDPLGPAIATIDGALREFSRDVETTLELSSQVNTITVVLADDDGNELYRHDIPASID